MGYLQPDMDVPSLYQIRFEQVALSGGDNINTLYDENVGNLNILTLDTGFTGIAMQGEWEEMVLEYITNSRVSLVRGEYYAYCIDTDHDHILDDIFDKLPDINIKLSRTMTYIISPQQYVVDINNDSMHYQFCLDISFDEHDGLCLGSHVMENYLILYDDDDEKVGFYDANKNHERQQIRSGTDSLKLIEREKSWIYALSVGLFILLICLLFISGICVCLLRKMSKSRNQNYEYDEVASKNGRRKSVTIDSNLSPKRLKPQCIDINSPEQRLELDSSNNSNVNSGSSSVSPLQKYLDGNFKSIVYDRIIKPWNMEQELDAI